MTQKNCIIYTTGLYINVAFHPIISVSYDILKESTNNYTTDQVKTALSLKFLFFGS